MAGEDRALLIYDGDCEFCRHWIGYWRFRTGGRVQYASSQEIASAFPDVPREKYARAVQLIDEDGSRHEGAAAVFRLISKIPGCGWVMRLYEAPAVAPVSEWAYRLVARRRPLFLKLTHLLWGKQDAPPRYGLTARLLLQVLSATYFIAFVSAFAQLPGLRGTYGLIPSASVGTFQLAALAGALAALFAFGGLFIAPCFALMWLAYLALMLFCQPFAPLPWDILLLAAGFLAIVLVPFRGGAAYRSRIEASPTVIGLFRFLLFCQLFASGLMRLASLSFPFETQPLPTVLAWHAHQLPELVLRVGAAGMGAFELFVSLLFLLPQRARRLGALLMALMQVLALLFGAAAFFHWVLLALCLPLLDDGAYERFFSRATPAQATPVLAAHPARRAVIAVVAAVTIAGGFLYLAMPADGTPLGSRRELVIEGSTDGTIWKEYAFKRKPGDVKRSPAWASSPLPTRLDWLLPSAARGEPDASPWVANLMIRLLQGSKPVIALLDENPFPDAPPAFVRATVYSYRFTTPEERKRDGAWWRREMKAAFLPTLSLTGGAQ